LITRIMDRDTECVRDKLSETGDTINKTYGRTSFIPLQPTRTQSACKVTHKAVFNIRRMII
jgi:hypothetical protein